MAYPLTNEIGNQHGELTVLERANPPLTVDGYARWLCRCSCGRLHEVSGHQLRSGKIKSCGCLKKINHWRNKDRRR